MRFSFLLRLPVLLFIAHCYVAWRLATGMDGRAAQFGTILVVGLSYLILMAGFMARDKVGTRWSDAVSWAGFLTLGFFSWLFVLTALRDVLLGLIFVLKRSGLLGSKPWLLQIEAHSAAIVFLLSVLACVIGFYQARRIPKIKKVDVYIENLPSEFDGFRIVQITDLHVGPTIKRGFVQNIVDRSNKLDGDIIVLTGDLIDGSVEQLAKHTKPLGQLRARYGCFVVTGNHEYYAGALPWLEEFDRLGLTVLLNDHRVIERNRNTLVVAGVTDFGAEKFEAQHRSDPAAALRHAPTDAAVKVLLAHQPRSIFAAAPLNFDLQLSGHTHGGQFWPWNHFVPMQQPFVHGLHTFQNTQLYISRGTGYWGPPLRLGAQSEISCIQLRRATKMQLR